MKHTKIGVFDWSILGTDEDNIDFIGPDVVPPEGYARIELECTDSNDQHFIDKEIASSSDEALGDHRWFEYTVYQLLDGSTALATTSMTQCGVLNQLKEVLNITNHSLMLKIN